MAGIHSNMKQLEYYQLFGNHSQYCYFSFIWLIACASGGCKFPFKACQWWLVLFACYFLSVLFLSTVCLLITFFTLILKSHRESCFSELSHMNGHKHMPAPFGWCKINWIAWYIFFYWSKKKKYKIAYLIKTSQKLTVILKKAAFPFFY